MQQLLKINAGNYLSDDMTNGAANTSTPITDSWCIAEHTTQTHTYYNKATTEARIIGVIEQTKVLWFAKLSN